MQRCHLHPAASGYLHTSVDCACNGLDLVFFQFTDRHRFLVHIISMRIITDQITYRMYIDLFEELFRLLSDSFQISDICLFYHTMLSSLHPVNPISSSQNSSGYKEPDLYTRSFSHSGYTDPVLYIILYFISYSTAST